MGCISFRNKSYTGRKLICLLYIVDKCLVQIVFLWQKCRYFYMYLLLDDFALNYIVHVIMFAILKIQQKVRIVQMWCRYFDRSIYFKSNIVLRYPIAQIFPTNDIQCKKLHTTYQIKNFNCVVLSVIIEYFIKCKGCKNVQHSRML